MSKEWGRSKGLNPVLYIRKGSTLSAHVQGLKPILLEGGIAETGFSDQQKTVLDILRYIKSFEGTFLRGEEKEKPIKFYDEREIRYVPPAEPVGFYLLTEPRYLDEKARNTAKEVLEHQHYRLTFEPADIKYIIISDETEIPTIVKAIAELEYDEPNRQRLLTRITSCKQIEEDF